MATGTVKWFSDDKGYGFIILIEFAVDLVRAAHPLDPQPRRLEDIFGVFAASASSRLAPRAAATLT